MTNYFHNCVQYDQHQQEHYQLKERVHPEIKIFLIKKGILVIGRLDLFPSVCFIFLDGNVMVK